MTDRRVVTVYGVSSILLVVAIGLRLSMGSNGWGWPSMLIVDIRMDRMFVGVVVGASLAVAGVALQALLRNALAEPFILGLSTGAAAGMVGQWWLAATLGVALGAGYGGAAIGAMASMAVVFVASMRRGVIDPLGLLLTGVVLSTINGAFIMLATHLRPELVSDVSQWMMGFIREGRSDASLYVVCAFLVLGLVVLLVNARAMDVATLSPGEAKALGVALPRLRVMLFVVSGLLAAGAVVLSGPIAFVGLVCPHVARLMVGAAHRPVLIVSAMLGAALVLLSDTAGAALAYCFNVGVVPLGIFTAVIGGVTFLSMLRGRLGRG